MILFAVLACMALAAMACILAPLLRKHETPQSRAAHDVEIYRDQLAELERDRARGLVTDRQFDALRAEIGRRLLAADAAAETAPEGRGAPRTRMMLAAALAVALPLGAGALYFRQGAPSVAGSAAPQAAAPDSRPAEPPADMAALVRQLAERLQERPDNAEGWRMLGRSLASLERYAEAADAYGRASALLPADAGLQALRGEALAVAGAGMVTPEAERAFAAALALDPGEPRARFYLGLAALQKGDRSGALARWRALEAASPADAEWLPMLRWHIDGLASADEATPGPTREDIAAAQQMTPEEREEAVRGMVGRLALRLEEEPGDVEGWERLARSYRVLGEAGKERDALAALARLLPEGSPARIRTDRRIEALEADQ